MFRPVVNFFAKIFVRNNFLLIFALAIKGRLRSLTE